MCNVTGLYKHDNSKCITKQNLMISKLMARNIWPLVQNRNEEEWTIVHSDEWRFPLGRVDFYNSAGACLSVSVSVCPRTFVNNSGTDGPIWTRQTPKDAPKRRNDDGVCHVPPRGTWHVHVPPREPLAKTLWPGYSPNGKSPRAQTFREGAPWCRMCAM